MANILVVDDDADLRELLRTALARDGHLVTLLPSGSDVTEAHCRWADVYKRQEQHCCGYVADHLTTEDGDRQAALLHCGGECCADSGEPTDISGEEKKTDEGEKQTVIHTAQQRPVKKLSLIHI